MRSRFLLRLTQCRRIEACWRCIPLLCLTANVAVDCNTPQYDAPFVVLSWLPSAWATDRYVRDLLNSPFVCFCIPAV